MNTHQEEVSEESTCPYCGSLKIHHDPYRGEFYCGVCGYVLEIENVPDQELIATAANDFEILKTFCLDKVGKLGGENTYNKYNKKEVNKKEERIHELQKEINSEYMNDNTRYALSEIKRLGSKFNLPFFVIYNAELIYSRFHKTNALKDGHLTIEAVTMAAVSYSMKQYNISRDYWNEIYIFSKVSPDAIHTAYLKLIKKIQSKTT